MNRYWLIAILFLLLASPMCNAQGQFFWSPCAFGEGADPFDVPIKMGIGQKKEIFFYYQTMGQDISDGFRFDLSFSEPDVVLFSSASTLNFDVTISGAFVGIRWDQFGDADVSDNAVQNFTPSIISHGQNVVNRRKITQGGVRLFGFAPTRR